MARKIHYCVQPYERKGQRLSSSPLRTFDYPDLALRSAKRMAGKAAGVVAYSREGDGEYDDWGTPLVIARHGDLPEIEF